MDHHVPAPPSVKQVVHSPGRPLDLATRELMEARMGYDFSRIRVHTDDRAAASADAIHARAYAAGEHIVFGSGQFVPHSRAGLKLVAHELVHTLQAGNDGTHVRRQPRDLTHVDAVPADPFARLWIAVRAAGPRFLRSLNIALAIVLVLSLLVGLFAMIFPEVVAAVSAALSVTVAGVSLAAWLSAALAALGLSQALTELVEAYRDLNRVVMSENPSRAELEEAGRVWGSRTGEAVSLMIPALARLPDRVARLFRRQLRIPERFPPSSAAPPRPPVARAVRPRANEAAVAEGAVESGVRQTTRSPSPAPGAGPAAPATSPPGSAAQSATSELEDLRRLARTDPEAAHALLRRYRDMPDSELFRRYVDDADETAAAVIRQRYPSNEVALRRILGSDYRPPHSATAILRRRGQQVWRRPLESGRMTPEERALGFPRNMLATHTEARAVRQADLRPGDLLEIRGQYDPCGSCIAAMQEAARRTGATIRYWWPGGSVTYRP